MTARRTVAVALLALSTLACADAKIDDMIAGGNLGSGELECWLTLVFGSYPEGVDPKDVKVRFSGDALDRPVEFDWSYIAGRDVVQGERFGSGNQPNDGTSGTKPPPLGQPVKVKFPLHAKRGVYKAGTSIWLEAELFWGGARQDSDKEDVQRLYAAGGSKGPHPWSM